MNEVLKELLPNPWAVDYQEPHDGRGFDLYDEKKMIEYGHRIIKECARLSDSDDTSYPYDSFGDKLKKHFGVEE